MTLAGRYQEKLINSGYYTIDTSINMVTAGLGINLIGLDKKLIKSVVDNVLKWFYIVIRKTRCFIIGWTY